MSFADFAAQYSADCGPENLQIGSQTKFLKSSGASVDRIFRYENIDRFVEFWEDRLDCAIDLPRTNVPPSVDVDLTPSQEAQLRQAMHQDLQLYSEIS